MKDKRIITLVVLFSAVLMLGGIGFAYAFFVGDVEGNGQANLLESGELVLQFNDNTSISQTNIFPGDTFSKIFNVKNIGVGPTEYSVGWEEIDNTFINDEIEIRFDCTSYSTYIGLGDAGNVEEGSCSGNSGEPAGDLDTYFVENTIAIGYTHEYTATVTFVRKNTNQDYNKGKSFYGKLKVQGGGFNAWYLACGTGSTTTDSLRCKMINDNGVVADNVASTHVTSPTGVDFSQSASNYYTYSETSNKIVSLPSSNNMYLNTSFQTSPDTNQYFTFNGTAETNQSFAQSDIGKYTCGSNSGSECKTIYRIIQVTGSTVTKADVYERVPDESGLGGNGLGLYYTEDPTRTENGKRVYYYRGNVTNNYVVFADFCWRIVRTNEDGSTKLIYGGVATPNGDTFTCPQTGEDIYSVSSAYNSSYDDNMYVGYMYGDKGDLLSESTTTTISEAYYYARSYTMNGNSYVLNNDDLVSGIWNTSDICDSSSCRVANYYTCKSAAANGTCTTLYKIESFNSSTIANVKTIVYASNSYNNAHANIHNSTIKDAIDNWYTTNISNKGENITNLIYDTPYCNDRSIDSRETTYNIGFSKNYTNYATYTRLIDNKQPTFICKNENDKFTMNKSKGNGALDYSTALITADEVCFAGAYFSGSLTFSSTYISYTYLNTNNAQYTMSAVMYSRNNESANVIIMVPQNSHSLGITSSRRARAVISLNSSASVLSGTGVYNNPYVINTN